MAGITIVARQAKKVFGNKKTALISKALAHALWSSDVLAHRSVNGASAPKNKGPDLASKLPLSTLNVDAIKGKLYSQVGTLNKFSVYEGVVLNLFSTPNVEYWGK